MLRKLLIGALGTAAALSIVVGVQRWLDARAARGVARRFMEAATTGDHETLLSLLHPQRLRLVEAQSDRRSLADRWPPQAGTRFRIRGVELDGSEAVVEVSVEKDGFEIRPRIHLLRAETTRWKVAAVDNLAVDPRWRDLRRRLERERGEALAASLKQALEGRPGVRIDRTTLPAMDR